MLASAENHGSIADGIKSGLSSYFINYGINAIRNDLFNSEEYSLRSESGKSEKLNPSLVKEYTDRAYEYNNHIHMSGASSFESDHIVNNQYEIEVIDICQKEFGVIYLGDFKNTCIYNNTEYTLTTKVPPYWGLNRSNIYVNLIDGSLADGITRAVPVKNYPGSFNFYVHIAPNTVNNYYQDKDLFRAVVGHEFVHLRQAINFGGLFFNSGNKRALEYGAYTYSMSVLKYDHPNYSFYQKQANAMIGNANPLDFKKYQLWTW